MTEVLFTLAQTALYALCGYAVSWLFFRLMDRREERAHRGRCRRMETRWREECDRYAARRARSDAVIAGPELPTDANELRKLYAAPTDGAAARFDQEGGLLP